MKKKPSNYKHGIITDVLVKMLEEAKTTAKNQLEWDEAAVKDTGKPTMGSGSIMSGILGAVYDNGFEEKPGKETVAATMMRELLYFHVREAIPVFFPQYKNIEDLDKANVKKEIMIVFDCAIEQAIKKTAI